MVLPTMARANCKSDAATTEDIRQLDFIVQRGKAIDNEDRADLRRAWLRNIEMHISASAAFHVAGCPASRNYKARVMQSDVMEAAKNLLRLLATEYGNKDGALDKEEIVQLMQYAGPRALIQASKE